MFEDNIKNYRYISERLIPTYENRDETPKMKYCIHLKSHKVQT